ncbi:N-glycosidase R617 [Trichoderma ghanense]|uniref:N-glycosidase R617 n=1 Tax=Trichoderma ghanense TaxID=65468 RepID=A0ABY2H4S0_9HYPO
MAEPSGDSEPIYFWRETDPQNGYLSQWYYCPFRDDKDPNIIYETAEHYMMYQKALLFNDHPSAHKILSKGQTPRKVKSLGRKVANFSEKTWTAKREEVVRQGNYLKFTNAVKEIGFSRGSSSSAGSEPLVGGSLRETLLSTGERELVEASPFDAVWGIGLKAADADGNREAWGLNLLGRALMDVRKRLREEKEAAARVE